MPKTRRTTSPTPPASRAHRLNRKAIRQALRFWGSAQKLGEHPLAGLEIVEARRKAAGYGQTPVGCGVALREVLHDAILKLKPDAGEPDWQEKSWRPYLILSQQYLDGRSPNYLIEQLSIARSTYDHEQAQAFESLADILRQWEELRSRPAQPTPATPAPVPFLAPPCPPQPLLGREAACASAKAALLVHEGLAAAALDGLPGVGKTALAIELAHDPEVLSHFSEGVLWASLGPQPDLLALLGSWAAALGLPAEEIAKASQVEKRAAAVHAAFGMRRMLLVIDNAWKSEDALAFKVGGPHCAYLVTTRLPKVALDFAGHRAATLHELNEADGLALLAHFAPEVVASESAEARALVEAAGCLPLALVLMGKYLQQEARTGQPRRLRTAVERLRQAEARLQLKQAPAPLEQQPSQLLAAIAVSEETLDETARRALRALAVFPPKPNSFTEAAALAVSAASVEALDQLSDYGLLECRSPGRYALHQTIAEYALFPTRDEAAAERLAAYFVRFAEAHAIDYEALDAEADNCLFGLQAAGERHLHADLIRGANACYGYLASRGAYALAQTYLGQAAEAARALNDTVSLIGTLSNLGQAAQRQGEYAQAERHYQEALALARKLGERESLSQVLQGLGAVAFSQGQFDQAEAFYQEGLALAQAIGSQGALCTLYGNLGVLLVTRGDYGQAETYFSEGLALARAMDHRSRISALLTNLGVVAARRGNFARADTCFQESLELARASGHRENICLLLINLGSLANDRQDFSAAEAYFQEGLALAQQMGNRVRISHLLANLGALALRRKDYPQAETYLQEGLTLARLTRHRENIVQILTNLGQWAFFQGQAAQAEAYLQEGLALAREMGHHRYLGIILNHLGELQLALAKGPEAEAAFGEARSIAQNLNAPETLAAALFGLARLAAQRGDALQAREQAQKSLEIFDELHHSQTSIVRAWLDEAKAL
jgi:tetratricopeptide (TPR) repeat protein